MSTHKYIDRICIFGLVMALLLSALFVSGSALGIQPAKKVVGYENRLFDTSRVHTIDIVMDDWDSFINSCRNEEYVVCNLIVDGEAYKNVAIRGKGNTSLSTVSSMNSNRYSFKVEFDHYDNTKTYHGLDKLSLNNLIQDNTLMKDYLTYQLMGRIGAAAPLCSYVYITVNGEDWGLYLAVEGVEDSFLQRNYGSDHGDLYKPDSLSFGGGRGNGKDFNMDNFLSERSENDTAGTSEGAQLIQPPSGNNMQQFPGSGQSGSQKPSGSRNDKSGFTEGSTGKNKDSSSGFADFSGMFPTMGGNFSDISGMFPGMGGSSSDISGMFPTMGGNSTTDFSDMFSNMGGIGGFFGGMGSSDVLLQYTNDDPSSYSNIFSSAKTTVTEADQARLIQALKGLSQGDAENAVNIEQVIRYFVVHNFVVNGDSYTGSMIHNYYLYEEDGKLEMLPWDYNLAFGTFQSSNAQSAVNDPIDTPLSVTGSGRPIIDWIFASEEYTNLYHQYFAEFLEQTDFAQLIDQTAALISPYVEKDPTKFCTFAEFETGVATLREFCLLREESIQGQLDGVIPSTSSGQKSQSGTLVNASHLTLSDMGSMGMGGGKGGFGGGFGGNFGSSTGDSANNSTSGNRNDRWQSGNSTSGSQRPNSSKDNTQSGETQTILNGFQGNFPTGGFPSADSGMTQFPEGTTPSTGMFPGMGGDFGSNMPSFGGISQRPSGSVSGNMASPTSGTGTLFGISVLLLAAAILVAKLYKRR